MQRFNHPLTLAIALTLVVTATQKLAAAGFKKIGWTGPASFFGK